MKPFPEDPSFTPGEKGFDDKDENGRPYDLLGRKPVGQRLTDLLDRVEQPLVIALDGGWGSGKSHFLKLWTGAHEKELGGKAKVIYFDAFEHDYLDDPLISLVARLTMKNAETTWGSKAVKAVKKAALPLARLSMRVGAAVATAGATEVVGPIADAVVTKTGEATQAYIDAFWKRETGRIAAMQKFRDALTALTKSGDKPQKIVFIIDELDRCRPDYALTLLEIVKHFFSVPNVHFVLGTNLAALDNSVRARYGEQIDGLEYLLKFINLRLTLGAGQANSKLEDWETYTYEIMKRSEIDTALADSIRNCLKVFSSRRHLGFRDVDRIITRAQILPQKPLRIHPAFCPVAAALVILTMLAPRAYESLRRHNVTFDQFKQTMDAFFPIESRNAEIGAYSQELRDVWAASMFPIPPPSAVERTRAVLGQYNLNDLYNLFQLLILELFDTFELLQLNHSHRER
jgi:hypothetical protein